MKKYAFLFLIFSLNIFCLAQSLPKLSPIDFGYSNGVKSINSVKYFVDGDSLQKLEENYYYFGPNKKIMVFTEKDLRNKGAKKSTIYKYENDEVKSEKYNAGNEYQDYEVSYQYDADKSLLSSQYISKYINLNKKYNFTGNKLSSVITTNEMGKSEESYFYNNFGDLYAIHNTETVGKDSETIVTLFQNNREIARYSTSKSRRIGLNYITNSKEFSYATSDESIKKELETLELFLKQNKSKDLIVAQKIEMILKKAKNPELISAKFFIRNAKGDPEASAELEAPFEDLKIVTFYRIDYSNGSIEGSTDFQKHHFQDFQNRIETEKQVGLLNKNLN